MTVMGKLLSGSAPLRGRASLELDVPTLDFRQAARFWEIDDPRLAALLHAVVGGTPAYKTEYARGDRPTSIDDFDDWVVRTVLDATGPLFREARYLLAEEPGLREPSLYHSVLAAVAEGNATRGGIADYVGRSSSDLAHPLNVLEDAGLLVRESDAFRPARPRFRIAEPPADLPPRGDASVVVPARAAGTGTRRVAIEPGALLDAGRGPSLRADVSRVDRDGRRARHDGRPAAPGHVGSRP
jgi:uncharacterized protein